MKTSTPIRQALGSRLQKLAEFLFPHRTFELEEPKLWDIRCDYCAALLEGASPESSLGPYSGRSSCLAGIGATLAAARVAGRAGTRLTPAGCLQQGRRLSSNHGSALLSRARRRAFRPGRDRS